MLQFELKRLQELGNSLDPEGNKKNPQLPALPTFRLELEKECTRIKEAMSAAIFTPEKDEIIERYIQYHQTGIIQIADHLFLVHTELTAEIAGQQDVAENEQDHLYGVFIRSLSGLLNHIEVYFSKYFAQDFPVPKAYHLMILEEMGERIGALQALIDERVLAEGLKYCLNDYLSSFSDEQSLAEITFRNVTYLKAFVKELEQTFEQEDITDWDQKLAAVLIYLNFNHLAFLVYYQESVRAELDNTDSSDGYRNVLSAASTRVKGFQSKPGLRYAPAWPEIKTMLESWLSDEIAISALAVRAERTGSTEAEAVKFEKMVLNLSVAHIACVTRLFYEENCFATSSVTDILKFMTKSYQSKRQQQISPGSLSKEYYGISQVTAAMVRDLFQRMVARINKTYFPVWVCNLCSRFWLINNLESSPSHL